MNIGDTMKKMIAAWVFLATILFGTLLYIGITFNKSIEEYQIIESDLKEAAQAYIRLKSVNLVANKEVKITEDDLAKENLLPNMATDDDECHGYINVKYAISEVEYTPFIECNNYKTKQ